MRRPRVGRHLAVFAALGVFAAAFALSRVEAQVSNGLVRVVISTSAGAITVALDSAHAPITVTNVLRYIDAARYTSGAFHRSVSMANQPRDSVRIEVIQAGPRRSSPDSSFAPIPLERTRDTGLRHTDGALSMARAGPNTATGDFFVTIGAQPSLDFGGHRHLDGQGFAVFGYVTSGMDVVRKIQQSPVTGQSLTPPIVITRISRVTTR